MSLKTLALLVFAAMSLTVQAQSLTDAFNQGAALGRNGNAAARSQINGDTAQSTVPGYTPNPPQTSYFGGPGIAAPAAAAANACPDAGNAGDHAAQACNAINFSQTNPTRRPLFDLGSTDPLLTGAKPITADPQAIAGNIAGTYSSCTVLTSTAPDRFEAAMCHQYRTVETLTCGKVLIVTPTQTSGCSNGQLLTRVTADPCPTCDDYLAFDFSCASNGYLMHVFTITKINGQVLMELGSKNVPGALNTQIPQTPGPSRIDKNYCYRTTYSQSCAGATCSISAWFTNPCQGTSYHGASSFAIPTKLVFIDTWNNQCAALEARAQ